MPNFADLLIQAVRKRRTPAVVGIDPQLERLPEPLRCRAFNTRTAVDAIESFSRDVIDAVADVVPAVKINSAFFEAYYEHGFAAFFRCVAHARARGLIVISDVKRGDIGSTNAFYAAGHLDKPRFSDVDEARLPDAVTLAGYMGEGAIRQFIDAAKRTGRGMFILVRPSDPGADQIHEFGAGEKLYQHLARLVAGWGDGLVGESGYSSVGAVVAPKDASSTAALRASMPRTIFLVPGYGAQGAGAVECRACFDARGGGAVVNASRSVIYAFDGDAAREKFGGDWRAAIRDAAQSFAADVAKLMQPLQS